MEPNEKRVQGKLCKKFPQEHEYQNARMSLRYNKGRGECVLCALQRYKINKPQILANLRAYNERNKEKKRQRNKKYYEQHRAEILEKGREYSKEYHKGYFNQPRNRLRNRIKKWVNRHFPEGMPFPVEQCVPYTLQRGAELYGETALTNGLKTQFHHYADERYFNFSTDQPEDELKRQIQMYNCSANVEPLTAKEHKQWHKMMDSLSPEEREQKILLKIRERVEELLR